MADQPVAVVPALVVLGEQRGQRLTLLSLELWGGWADLRFARQDVGAPRPVPRRVPPAEAWVLADSDGVAYRVDDVVGRGDRDLSVGEVRLRPAPRLGVTLRVAVRLWPDGPPLQGAIEVTERPV